MKDFTFLNDLHKSAPVKESHDIFEVSFEDGKTVKIIVPSKDKEEFVTKFNTIMPKTLDSLKEHFDYKIED
jgi:hypothetical protein